MKIKAFVKISTKSQSKHTEILEIDDTELEGFSSAESRDDFIQDYVVQALSDNVEYGWEEIES